MYWNSTKGSILAIFRHHHWTLSPICTFNFCANFQLIIDLNSPIEEVAKNDFLKTQLTKDHQKIFCTPRICPALTPCAVWNTTEVVLIGTTFCTKSGIPVAKRSNIELFLALKYCAGHCWKNSFLIFFQAVHHRDKQ